MKTTSAASAFALALLCTACTYPTTTVKTVDARPTIAFANASPTAMFSIDGVLIGAAEAYDGKKNVFRLDRGTHKVEVSDGGRVVLSQAIYLGDDMLKTISLPK